MACSNTDIWAICEAPLVLFLPAARCSLWSRNAQRISLNISKRYRRFQIESLSTRKTLLLASLSTELQQAPWASQVIAWETRNPMFTKLFSERYACLACGATSKHFYHSHCRQSTKNWIFRSWTAKLSSSSGCNVVIDEMKLRQLKNIYRLDAILFLMKTSSDNETINIADHTSNVVNPEISSTIEWWS